MPTVSYGPQKEVTFELKKSDELIAVRTRSRRSLRAGPGPRRAAAEVADGEVVFALPEAGVEVYRVPAAGHADALQGRKEALRRDADVEFAGGVLVNEAGEPVLYTENLFIKFVDSNEPEDCKRVLEEAGLTIKRPLAYATNAFFAALPEGSGQKVFEVAQALLQRPDGRRGLRGVGQLRARAHVHERRTGGRAPTSPRDPAGRGQNRRIVRGDARGITRPEASGRGCGSGLRPRRAAPRACVRSFTCAGHPPARRHRSACQWLFSVGEYPSGGELRSCRMTTSQIPNRRLFVSMIVSLDGYIEGPKHELDWFPEDNPQFQQYADEMIDSVGLALYGRRSYELMLSYWPNAEKNPRSPMDLAFAQRMNALPKVVLSRTLERAEWSNTTVVREQIRERVCELKQQPGKPIVAWAGAGLVSTLARLDLVDEYRLLVCPAVLGGGTPFFADRDHQPKLKLVRTTQLGPSVVVLCYEPVRA